MKVEFNSVGILAPRIRIPGMAMHEVPCRLSSRDSVALECESAAHEHDHA
jgi:hypothetical protein